MASFKHSLSMFSLVGGDSSSRVVFVEDMSTFLGFGGNVGLVLHVVFQVYSGWSLYTNYQFIYCSVKSLRLW